MNEPGFVHRVNKNQNGKFQIAITEKSEERKQ